MPGTRHEKIVDDLERDVDGFRRHGFRKSLYETAFKPSVNDVEEAEDASHEEIVDFDSIYKEACKDKRSEVREMCYGVPDGYVIDSEKRIVSVYEVEVGGRLSDKKLESYAYTWEWLNYYDWDFRLILVDSYGKKADWDLKDTYYKVEYPGVDEMTKLAIQVNMFHIGKSEVSDDVIELAAYLKKKFTDYITGDANETYA